MLSEKRLLAFLRDPDLGFVDAWHVHAHDVLEEGLLVHLEADPVLPFYDLDGGALGPDLHHEVVLVVFDGLPGRADVRVFERQLFLGVVGLDKLLQLFSGVLLLEAMVQRSERLGFSEGFLDIFDLDVGSHHFLYKLQEEFIFEAQVILVSIDELIFKNKSDHVLSFCDVLLFEFKFLADQDLDARDGLRNFGVGVFFPFLDKRGQDWD